LLLDRQNLTGYAQVLEQKDLGGRNVERAYLIGHLGKYVPGKAMVVVLRVGLITPYGARAATAERNVPSPPPTSSRQRRSSSGRASRIWSAISDCDAAIRLL